MRSPFDLSGATALVTGAKRGIGLAMAEALALAGANVIGVSATLGNGESEVRSRVEAAGREFRGFAIDFADRAAVRQFATEVQAASTIDILLNNAGTIRRSPAQRHSLEDWDEVIAVNLTSQFVLAQSIGAGMLERGAGKVIFTASLLSFQGGINVPGYTASKSGVAGLVKALANEWTAGGVCVNAIAPGYIATDNTQALRDDADRSQAILDRIPAGRWGKPSDIGGATVFLASSASDYVSGIVLPVDGGWLGR